MSFDNKHFFLISETHSTFKAEKSIDTCEKISTRRRPTRVIEKRRFRIFPTTIQLSSVRGTRDTFEPSKDNRLSNAAPFPFHLIKRFSNPLCVVKYLMWRKHHSRVPFSFSKRPRSANIFVRKNLYELDNEQCFGVNLNR